MIDKKLIFELYKKRHSQTEIASIIGVSRQRIHQILKNYRTITRTKKHIDKLSNGCAICYERAYHLHHIDGNPHHNLDNNLLPVCVRCHGELHRGIKHDTVRHVDTYKCLYCMRQFRRWHGYNGGKALYCSGKCRGLDQKKGKWSIKYSECITCKSTAIPHTAKGLCRNCYANYFRLNKKQKDSEFA